MPDYYLSSDVPLVHPSKALYRRAADIMELKGKCERNWIKEGVGSCCIGGAVMLAAYDGYADTCSNRQILFKPLYDHFKDDDLGFVQWSDSHTKAECVAKLREIAETLE